MFLPYYLGGIFFTKILWNVLMDASLPLSNLIIHRFANPDPIDTGFIDGRNSKTGL